MGRLVVRGERRRGGVDPEGRREGANLEVFGSGGQFDERIVRRIRRALIAEREDWRK